VKVERKQPVGRTIVPCSFQGRKRGSESGKKGKVRGIKIKGKKKRAVLLINGFPECWVREESSVVAGRLNKGGEEKKKRRVPRGGAGANACSMRERGYCGLEGGGRHRNVQILIKKRGKRVFGGESPQKREKNNNTEERRRELYRRLKDIFLLPLQKGGTSLKRCRQTREKKMPATQTQEPSAPQSVGESKERGKPRSDS